MTLNIAALASRVAAVGVTASQAVTITNEVVSLIGVVENVYAGLKGSAKFQAVMSGLDAVIAQLGLTHIEQAIRNAVAPMINLVVSVLNAGSLWSSVFGAIASFAETASKDIAGLASQTTAAPAPAPEQAAT